MANKDKIFDKNITTASFFLIILTVVYSTDKYDIWDTFVSGFLLYGLLKYQKQIIEDLYSLTIFRIGISICSGIFLTSIYYFYSGTESPIFSFDSILLKKIFTFIDTDFCISTGLFLVSLLLFKKHK